MIGGSPVLGKKLTVAIGRQNGNRNSREDHPEIEIPPAADGWFRSFFDKLAQSFRIVTLHYCRRFEQPYHHSKCAIKGNRRILPIPIALPIAVIAKAVLELQDSLLSAILREASADPGMAPCGGASRGYEEDGIPRSNAGSFVRRGGGEGNLIYQGTRTYPYRSIR